MQRTASLSIRVVRSSQWAFKFLGIILNQFGSPSMCVEWAWFLVLEILGIITLRMRRLHRLENQQHARTSAAVFLVASTDVEEGVVDAF